MKRQKERVKKKRISFSTVFLTILLIAGLSIMLYPSVSNYINTRGAVRSVLSYQTAVEEIDQDKIDAMLNEARTYNEALANDPGRYNPTDEEDAEYKSILDITGSGVMGYVSIPKIDVELPIYHGTDDSILTIAAGHLEGSSFPVGGTGTHAVLTGHRGLPRAKLFTDLDQMVEGDTFSITVLNQTLTYQVDQIRIVLPQELYDLEIDPNQDYVTLVTCTPYGINSHRLLVRGHRIATPEDQVHVIADAVQIDPMYVIPVLTAVILLVMLMIGIIRRSRSGKRVKERYLALLRQKSAVGKSPGNKHLKT
jgi:sortase A